MQETLRAALFVDFDNVYSSLLNEDAPSAAATRADAASAFAAGPVRWLDYFARGLHATTDPALAVPRAILVRRCYLNPAGSLVTSAGRVQFHQFRSHFTDAGFAVVDCPPLTRRSKNSADIVMVMDIIDALTHPTRFDEFIILTADADFTPVLLRLRAHDRRTTVLVNPLAARAFRSACDVMVEPQDFIARALDIVDLAPPPVVESAPGPAGPDALARLGQLALAYVGSHGAAPISDLVMLFRREVPEFRNSLDWLGHGRATALFEQVVRQQPGLSLDRSVPQRWVVRPALVAALDPALPPAERFLRQVRLWLEQSAQPIPLTELGQFARAQVAELPDGNWDGLLSLKAFLRERGGPKLQVLERDTGYAYDPSRHAVDVAAEAPRAGMAPLLGCVREALRAHGGPMPLADLERVVAERLGTETAAEGRVAQAIRAARDPLLAVLDIRPGFVVDPARDQVLTLAEDQALRPPAAAFVATVVAATGCPDLSALQHRSLFAALAEELAGSSYDPRSGWAFETLATAVEETCERGGLPVPHEAITFVLTGLEEPGETGENGSAADLAEAYADRLAGLCDEKGIELSAEERAVLALWIGATPEPQAAPLDMAQAEAVRAGAPSLAETLAEAARIAGRYVAAHGATPLIQLAGVFRREIPAFRDNFDWMGFGRITAFFEHLATLDRTLRLDRGQPRNWILWVQPPAPERFLQAVRERLESADGPVAVAELARLERDAVAELAAGGWAGTGSIEGFLAHHGGAHVGIARFTAAFAYDPTRDALPEGAETLD